MRDSKIQRAKLEQERKAIAYVHDGMYVYANPAFLKLLGFDTFEQLEGIPALDTVVDRHKDRLRDHLAQASRHQQGHEREVPKTKLTLVNSSGDHRVAITSFRKCHFDGEPAVELSLLTQQDVTLTGILLGLPWKLYISVLFLVLFTILPAGLLLGLNINNTPKVYLPSDAPSVVIDDRLREEFPNDQTILLLFEGVALYSEGFLSAFHGLANTLLEDPRIDDVVSVTTQDHISGTEDGFLVEPLIDVTTLGKSWPAERQQHALADRFASGTLVASDGSALGMLVTPVTINNSLQRMLLEDDILAMVKQARLSGYLTAMAGQIVTDVAQLRSMLRDNMVFIPGTVFIGLTLIWLLFHRWLAVLVSGIVIGVVVNCTVAFYVVFGQPFNLVSSIIPPLLSALTVAALIHLFNALHYASKRGLAGAARVTWAVREVERPAFFTAITTVAGLSSLGLSPIPPISVFGLTSAAGVALIYVIVVHMVPHLFIRFDFGDWPTKPAGLGGMDRLVKRLYRLGIRYPMQVIGGVILIIGLALPQIRNIVVETNLLEFFPKNHSVRVANEYVQEKLVGTTSLDVVFS
ncbi:MAG: MMPL family transporter, partial [Gammaproteobacteria bacterium]|nr:MMPL family transporter [Gammaproteobacteria bacterium]